MGLYSALAGICVFIKIRSLVWARDDVSGTLVVFSGCLLVFKTDEHKNKRFHLNAQMYVHASLTYLVSFNDSI